MKLITLFYNSSTLLGNFCYMIIFVIIIFYSAAIASVLLLYFCYFFFHSLGKLHNLHLSDTNRQDLSPRYIISRLIFEKNFGFSIFPKYFAISVLLLLRIIIFSIILHTIWMEIRSALFRIYYNLTEAAKNNKEKHEIKNCDK